MKRLILVLLVLGVALAGGYKGLSWWKAQLVLKQAREALAAHGVLSWGRVDPTFSGALVVNELRLQLFDLSSPIDIGQVTLDLQSPQALALYLLREPTALPEDWSLHVERIAMALREDLFKSWARVPGQSDTQLRPHGLFACGAVERLRPADLMAMGLNSVDADVRMDYQWRAGDDVARVQLELAAGPLGNVQFELVTPLLGQWAPILRGESPWPVPEQARLTWRDGGLMRRFAAYCGRQAGIAPTEWAGVAVKEWLAHLRGFGIRPSRQLAALYKTWLQDGGELQVILQPLEGFRFDVLERYSVADALRMAGLQVLYNGASVVAVSLELDRERLAATLNPPAAPDEATPVAPQVDEPAFRLTPVSDAERWRGRTVRLDLASGRNLEGRLAGVSEQQLDVVRLVNGGEVTYPIARDQITRFSVFRRAADRGDPVPVRAPSPVGEEG